MTATTKVPLGATTTNRKWYLDVDTGIGSEVWTGVFGIQEFKDALASTLQDSSDFDGEGWKSQDVTALAWSLEFKVRRAVTAASASAYDPGQEVLRDAAQETGIANSVHVRWYEMEPSGPRVEAYEGYASVQWSPDGGAMDALSTVTVTLTGQGKRVNIAHPSGVLDPANPDNVTPGTPGTFTKTGGNPVIIPASLAALQALGALNETTAWTTGQFVVLGDLSVANWNGTAWESGIA